MRLFVAIPMAAAVVEELAAVSMRLRSGSDGLRWTAPPSWHITLKFLGETGREQYACMVARLRELHAARVPVTVEGLGCFDHAGVFFAGVRLGPELLHVQQRVDAAAEQCGFAPESRPLQPHITLARDKSSGRHGLRQLKAKLRSQPEFSRFAAREFILYESFLASAGARYEVRERFPLDGDS